LKVKFNSNKSLDYIRIFYLKPLNIIINNIWEVYTLRLNIRGKFRFKKWNKLSLSWNKGFNPYKHGLYRLDIFIDRVLRY
jgi:hypothetical protein